MVVNTKRTRKIRMVFAIAVLMILVIVLMSVSLLSNRYHLRLMNMPEIVDDMIFRKSITDAADPTHFSKVDPAGDKYDKVAENEYLMLFLQKDLTGIAVYDKSSEYLWESVPEESFIEQESSGSYKNIMRSILNFTHIELTSAAMKTIVNTSYSLTEKSETRIERILGGVRILYDFTNLNIRLAVDVILDDSALVVSIPNDHIFENEEGVDTIAEVKVELEKEIETIRMTFEEVKSKSERNSEYSDSKKRAIELKINAAIAVLVTLKNQAGIGEVKTSQLGQLYEYIDDVIKFTSDMDNVLEKLQGIKDNSSIIMDKATALSKGKSTGIIALNVLPYFGAQSSVSNGYVFYPEGTGSISYFSTIHPAMSGIYNTDIYGWHQGMSLPPSENNQTDIQSTFNNNVSSMPVYGIKHQTSAFIAIITEGDCDASIQFNPTTPDRKMGNIFGSYYFRKSTTIVNAGGGHTYVYDSLRTKNNWETRYEFLAGEQANYSGMAVSYRNYLDQTGKLHRSSLMDNENMPISTGFFMGIYADQKSLINTYIPMTRFSDIQGFLERLDANGVSNVLVSSVNWNSDSGLKLPVSAKPASQTGGIKELKSLADYANKNKILFALDTSPTWVNSRDISFAQSSIAAVKAKSQMTRNYLNLRAVNPVYIYNEYLESDFKQLSSYGVNAMLFRGLNFLLYDYNKNAPCDRQDTADIFNLLTKETSSQFGYAVTDYANQYLFNSADWITSVPQEYNNYLFTDDTVPFYQIVLHGSVAYSGNGNNYFHSENRERLKEIEYGFIPYFFLTEKDTFELRNHGISGFYSTKRADWEDHIIRTAKKYNEDFKDTWNVRISSHSMLGKTLALTEYENGVRVYINYDTKNAVVDGISIPPENYVVITGTRSIS
ncbi:MAG: DUF5696 domain-containing protein [Saccharofermentanales bacterium]